MKKRSQTDASRRLRAALRAIVLWSGIAVAIAAIVGDSGVLGLLSARRQARELGLQIDQFRRQNSELREAARQLREDPKTIEDLARRELGLIRPGETLVIVRDISRGAATRSSTVSPEP